MIPRRADRIQIRFEFAIAQLAAERVAGAGADRGLPRVYNARVATKISPGTSSSASRLVERV